MDRKTITEWIKWGFWVASLVSVIVAWRVEIAKNKLETLARDEKELAQEAKINKLSNENEKLLEYVTQNKEGLIRVATWIEYDTRNESGTD